MLDEGIPSGDPSFLNIKVSERKPIQISFVSHGDSAHGSRISIKNAAHELILFLQKFALFQNVQLKELYIKIKSDKKKEGKLSGMTFVITGTLPSMSRDEAKDLIEKNGGHVSGSVSSKTSYLLAGGDPGSKFEKAQELGIKIVEEKDLREMF